MNEAIENYREWVEVLENSIFDEKCPSDFEEKFCDGNEMIELWFSSMQFKVSYITSSGATVSNTFSLEELSDWLDSDE